MILSLCNPKPDWAVQMFASLASVIRPVFLVAWLVANFVAVPHLAFAQVDPLPSWNDGPVKTSVIDFVARVTKQGGGDIEFVDDGPGKPVGINRFIGRRPIFAFGNSDGDLQMLQWTMAGEGARFAGLVHHIDAEREYAYDRQSKVGKLDKTLDEAGVKGWAVVDMKRDWKTVFPGGTR
jgi:hypothetical protein